MDKLYSGGYGHTCGAGCSHTFVNATDPFELVNNELFEKALLNIFAERVNVASEIEPNLFNATFGVLDNAIGETFGTVQWGDPNYEFVNELRYNTAVFSAFKTHDQQNEIAKLLVDDKGSLKSYAQFKKDSAPIIGKYNNNWLTTEYNTAVIRARAASQWKEFEADADLYPNLKWLPSTSIETRKSHEPYYNRVWAMNDPFWNGNHPGDLWNCKCGITNTDEPVDGHGVVANYTPAPGLKGNPGKTGELFDDSHPYIAGAPKKVAKIAEAKASEVVPLTSSDLRKKYMTEMEPLLKKTVTKEVDNKEMKISFTKIGNKHLFSDTFGRAGKQFNKEQLKNLDKILEESEYVKTSNLSKVRKDEITSFHYFKSKDGYYLNVAETEYTRANGVKSVRRFLYAITQKIK